MINSKISLAIKYLYGILKGGFIYFLFLSPLVSAQTFLELKEDFTLDVPEGNFGAALASDDNTLVVSSFLFRGTTIAQGKVYIYDRNSVGNWELNTTFSPASCPEQFGIKLALSNNLLAVGTSMLELDSSSTLFEACKDVPGKIYLYQRNSENAWNFLTTLIAPDSSQRFGQNFSLKDKRLVARAGDTNIFYVFGQGAIPNQWNLEDSLQVESPDPVRIEDIQVINAREIWIGAIPIGTREMTEQIGFKYIQDSEAGGWQGEVIRVNPTGLFKVDKGAIVSDIQATETIGTIGISTQSGTQIEIDTIDGNPVPIEVNVLNVGTVLLLDVNTFQFQGSFTPARTPREDALFGGSIVLNDELMIVGAAGDALREGAAYLYFKDLKASTPSFELLARLAASDSIRNRNFARNIALSGDTLIISASGTTNIFNYHLDIPQPKIQGADSVTAGDTSLYSTDFFEDHQYSWQVFLEEELIASSDTDFINIPWPEDSTTKQAWVIVSETSNVLGICKVDSFQVFISPLPPLPPVVDINLISNVQCLEGENDVQLAANAIPANVSYQWFKDGVAIDDQINNTLVVSEPGLYWVKVENEGGESISDTISVFSKDFFLPTLFTPNGDEVNDRFLLRSLSLGDIESVDMRIFDREGAMVYQSTELNALTEEGWNGQDNSGRAYPNGTYVYVVRVNFQVCGSAVKRGRITLIR